MSRIAIVIGLIISVGLINCFAQEQLTITTYYPSPNGSYRTLAWGNFPNTRGVLSPDQGSSINLGGSGTPFIDFYNDMNMANDFDVRIILYGDDILSIEGGNLGIGTSNPGAYRLYVNGNMYVNGDITTDTNSYGDYVFDSKYKLLSLKQLKKFIAEEKHLPNMPTAAQVKEDGYKLFEQNKLMLEKLEEAYLYILQLEDRVANLEKKRK